MGHIESKSTLRIALLAALGYGAIACSSDSDHRPPIGAPTTPVVITEGGGTGGSDNSGQAAANNGGETNTTNTAGSLNGGIGAFGGSGFADPSAGGPGLGSPATAGGTSEPPFSIGGGTSSSAGTGF